MSTFQKLTIIGLGLIGSSIARAARKRNFVSVITGVDSNEITLLQARKHGFVDQTSHDPAHAVAASDVVIIATPTHLLPEICQSIAPHLTPGTLVMDTGSVKQVALEMMTRYLPKDVLIVPAHPIAGSEKSGVMAGHEDLLDKKRVIITPESPLSTEQMQRVNAFWQATGARVEAMPAAMHDTIYGYVSHLPQLLVFAAAPLVGASDDELAGDEILARFLRISSSSRALWSGIALLNREVMLAALTRYRDVIAHVRRELSSAPDDAESEISATARLRLLPRILASCLITTVMEAEKKAGIGFVRFSGSGFADVTSPATSDPENDLPHISTHHAQLAALLGEMEARLALIHQALENEDASLLAGSLE